MIIEKGHITLLQLVILVLVLEASFISYGGQDDDLQAEVKKLESDFKVQQNETDAVKTKLADARRKLSEKKKHGEADINNTQFFIPRLKTAPVIDGIVGDKEWAGSVGIPLTTGVFGMFERQSSMFFVGWDPEYLYFAQRLPMREGELPLRLNREPKHDNVYCGETSLEVYVDRKSHGSHGSLCRWQFMGNAVGNRWDREDQYQIGQNFISWNGDWKYAQRLTSDGKFWEAEIAIPRTTVYQKDPVKDGDMWWIGMATNLHRPWCFSGFYGWKIPATFKDSIPEIRMQRPERSLAYRGIVFDMSIDNSTGKEFNGELIARIINPKEKDPREKILFEKVRPISLASGQKELMNVEDKAGDNVKDQEPYQMSVIVKQGDKSLYTWSYPLRYNHIENKTGLAYTPDEKLFPLFAYYSPLSNFVRIRVDKYDLKKSDDVVKASFTIRPDGKGKVIARGEIDSFKYGNGETKVTIPADITPGKYLCVAELLDKDGKLLGTENTSFVRKDHKLEFPWLNNNIGEDDIVVKPFEGLKVSGSVIDAYEKQITLGGCALPASIEAVGVKLLRAPVKFEGQAEGRAFEVKAVEQSGFLGIGGGSGSVLKDASETHADYIGQGRGGPVKISTEAHWEYDSTCKVRVILEPQGGTAKLDNLKLVIPFTSDGATYFMANGLNMRLSNIAGKLPKGDTNGVVWKSTDMPYQEMTTGSFVPIIWLGNLNSGMTWFADNDQGWWPSDKRPAAEIVRRQDGGVDMILNIASEPVEFSMPREIVFGFNVNPVRKPSPHIPSKITFGYVTETGRWDPKKTPGGEVFARRYPENPELNRKYADLVHKYNGIYAPYTEMSYQDFFPEEVKYFKEEWDIGGSVGGTLFAGKSSNDALLYMTKKWIGDCGLDGYYFDNVFNRLNWNTHYGSAYQLPDGRIQPGYNLWGMRSQIKRIRTLLQVEGRDPSRICIHNTRFQFAPIMGFADLSMGGEMAMPRGDNPGAGDFMDMHPREFMDVMYNQPLWGYKLSHLYNFRIETYLNDLGVYDREKALKVHRSAMATMLVHGVEFFQGIDAKSSQTGKFQTLNKLPGGNLEFVPSWQANGLFKLMAEKDLDVSIYRKQDVLLIIVANYSKNAQTARVWLDFPKLIRMPAKDEQRVVWDFETFEFAGQLTENGIPKEEQLPLIGNPSSGENIMHQDNIFRVKIEPRDFRAILVMNLPVCGIGVKF
ncbi:MAG: glycoside hydrolase domain-containing protein [Victivallales bacterium]